MLQVPERAEMTMFIRNCWYMVAWDHEVPADGLFSRTVIG